MGHNIIFSKASSILKHLKTKRTMKLYDQWIERAQLPPEAVPQKEFGEDITPKIQFKRQQSFGMLYITVRCK